MDAVTTNAAVTAIRRASIRRKAVSGDRAVVVILRCPRNARASKDEPRSHPSRLAQRCKCTARLAPPAITAKPLRGGDGAVFADSHPLHRHGHLRPVPD